MGMARLLAKGWMAFCLFAGAHALYSAMTRGEPLPDAASLIGICTFLFAAMGLLFVGGYAVVGRAKLGAGWIRNNVAAAGHLQTDIVFAGVAYALTPAVTFDAQGTRYLQRGPASNANATLLAGRANHQLSKRTRVYTSVGYMLNSASAGKAVAAGGTVETGQSQLGIMAGLQQRF